MNRDAAPLFDDPFDRLGVAAEFVIDEDALRRRWLSLAAKLHPDVAADSEEAGRDLARVSAAYGVIANPESRADALLVRLGGPSREDCRDLPAGFLMEMMAVREELEEAVAEGDEAAIARLRVWAAQQRARFIEEMKGAFAGLGESASAKKLRGIRERLNAWRYIERMIEQAG